MKSVTFKTLFALCFFSFILSNPSNAAEMAAIQAEARAAMEDFKDGKCEKLAEIVYPKLIEKAGGKEKMLEDMKKSVETMKENGVEFLEFEIGLPTEIQGTGENLATVVPQSARIKSKRGVLNSKSYLLAVSDNGGKTWTFIDGGKLTPEKIKDLLPESLRSVKLPKVEKPEFEKAPETTPKKE